ncbi:Ubiquitin-60S ribosomal protein [Drechslerella dactyloides]|uniref:Ubiquitin-60S ribosomal protein n=1 Tax=Drechslerella dactyloides TaxID=74499 RepID=A0AAD6ISW8_DREDA|nr:Ubiquitin-60S ribosomal protein [Drechslerella dactyloides]
MPLSVTLKNDTIIVDSKLNITFRRTIRVPDNDETAELPPDMGKMPLINVSGIASELPDAMAAKGGLMVTLHENEAMWIKFQIASNTWCPREYLPFRRHYALKIYAGGINVVSGEPENENTATTLRRRTLTAKGESIQDYVVVPRQKWIDGIAVAGGRVRQFVAAPLGSGLTIESQLTSEEVVGGLQFEIIATKLLAPAPRSSGPNGSGRIHVKTLNGYVCNIDVELDWHVVVVHEILEQITDIPSEAQRLFYAGEQLKHDRTLFSYQIKAETTIRLVLHLRGGGDGKGPIDLDSIDDELGIAAGGMIKQSILPDHIPDSRKFQWDKEDILVFNVQMLNAVDYTRITGGPKQSMPVSAQDYAASGGQFFDLEEEESNIYGDFGGIKSVGRLTGKLDPQLHIRSKKIGSQSTKDKGKSTAKNHEVSAKIPSYTYSETLSVSGPSHVYTENSSSSYGSIENSVAGGTSYTESTVSTLVHSSNEIATLTVMGFTRNQATKALRISSGNLERAAEWILDHLDGQDEAKSPPKKHTPEVRSSRPKDFPINPSAVITVQPKRSQFRTAKDLEESMKRVNVGTF